LERLVPVKVLSKKMLRDFWEKRPDAEQPLKQWLDNTRKAAWDSFADVRNTFRSSDVVGNCVVFNIHGNDYRLIVKINYKRRIVYTRLVLTHEQYNDRRWRKDECGSK
jgi:mRNA interferase HigB